MKISLHIVQGAQKGHIFQIERFGSYTIGRSTEADFTVVDDNYISRQHCIVEFGPNTAIIKDAGSSGGTYINGQKIQQAFLDHKDILQIGQTKIQVSLTLSDEDTILPDQGTGLPYSPQLIPGFTLIKELPMEGAGKKWWAVAEQSNQLITLHFLETAAANGGENQKRFLRNTSICSRVRHPGIVNFLDQGITNGYLWFATEVVEGQTLRQYVAKHGRLPTNKAIDLIIQASEIVEHLHQRDIVHRSLRPSSFHIEGTGHQATLKLVDLASAKCFSELNPITQLNDRGFTVHAYTALEVLTNSNTSTPKSDVYALGAILYFLVTGKDLFTGSSEQELITMIIKSNEHTRSAIRSITPSSLKQIIGRTVSPNMAHRPESTQALSSLLHQSRATTGHATPSSQTQDPPSHSPHIKQTHTNLKSQSFATDQSLVTLYEQMNENLSLEDIKTIYFALLLEYEQFGGEHLNKDGKIQLLIKYCYRQNRLPELRKLCVRQNRFVVWAEA